jgi:hypothetical protein
MAVGMIGLCLLVGWWILPALSNDFAAGWQVWLSMQAGAPFNSVWQPAADNLALDTAHFQSWWAPGQYLMPALLQRAGLSLGHAVVVTGVLANVLGLAGCWRLWRVWGIPPGLRAASGLIVVLGHPFGATIGVANIADNLLVAVVPWATLLVWHWRRLDGWRWFALLLILTAAVGLKLSFQVALLAMLAGVALQAAPAAAPGRLGPWLWLVARALLLWLAVKLAWQWGYLARGASIGVEHAPHFAGMAEATLPWGGPLLAVFGAGSLLSRIFLFPGHPLLADGRALWPVYLLGALATLGVVRRLWRVPGLRTYAGQLSAWLGVYGVVFTTLYATGAPVSLEERHFEAPGLLLLPGVLGCIAEMKGTFARRIARTAVAGLCLYGVAAIFVHARDRRAHGVMSRRGFLHTELTAGALAELQRLDDEPGGRTLFFTCQTPTAIEVRHGRVMCLPLDGWPEAFVRSFTFEGRVERLVLVMPARYVEDGRVEWIKAGLHGYHRWEARKIDGFYFITGR